MNFYNHTLNWITGELFEAYFITNFGIITIIGGILFGKFGSTLNAKALVIPLIVVGIVYTAIGFSMIVSNNNRLTSYKQDFEKDHHAFVKAEKKRVEDFQIGYTISKIVAVVFFPISLLLFWFSKNPALHGLGLGLAFFALAGLMVDYFSQERANAYYEMIVAELSNAKILN
ncbi:hypothetical protein NYQ10_14660 [Flavobacterium johnsoniae]|uniref:hypothetical protein n=1 Tax=Flavobacterium johnsoniae TaxID=986 RepID=UPI0025B23A71|nr:hypothetical protein [Flavobacterium johnsoniae]WJS93333.1 hypothetical protein NYQ10_14660 [Flavobacterium johnsoniae]